MQTKDKQNVDEKKMMDDGGDVLNDIILYNFVRPNAYVDFHFLIV